jgi:hypothetical protein
LPNKAKTCYSTFFTPFRGTKHTHRLNAGCRLQRILWLSCPSACRVVSRRGAVATAAGAGGFSPLRWALAQGLNTSACLSGNERPVPHGPFGWHLPQDARRHAVRPVLLVKRPHARPGLRWMRAAGTGQRTQLPTRRFRRPAKYSRTFHRPDG